MKRLSGYLLGIALTLFGILWFVAEFTDHSSKSTITDFTPIAIILLAGFGIIVGVSCRYGGGLWTVLGFVLTALGVLSASSILEDFLQKGRRPGPGDLFVCSVLLVLGIAFIGQGHRRHLWKKTAQLDEPGRLLRAAPWAPAWVGVVFGIWFVWHHINTTMKLGSFVYARKQDGWPVNVNELAKWYPPVASNQNAAVLYELAFASLVKPDAAIIERLVLGTTNLNFSGNAPEWAEARAVLARNRKTLELLHAAGDYSQSHYSSVFRPNSAPDCSHLDALWICMELLMLEDKDFSVNGPQSKTVDSAKTLLALGDSVANEPLLKSQWTRISSHGLASMNLEWALSFVALKEPELLRLDAALAQAQRTTDNTGAYLGDFLAAMQAQPYGCVDSTYRNSPVAAGLYKTVVFIADRERADKLYYAESVKDCLRVLKNGYPLRLQMWPDSEKATVYAERHGYFVSAYFMKMRRKFSVALAEDCARLRVLRTVVAIERYRLANEGGLPQNLKELTPRFLATVPEDPFDGYPLRYLQRPDKAFAVYSVGPNLRDDGGTPPKKGRESYDIVVRIRSQGGKSGFTAN